MEQIVRPFQLFDPSSAIRVNVVRDQVAVSPAHLCWGAVGQLPTAVKQTQPFNGINFRVQECNSQKSEVGDRQVEHLRVEQPDNPDNYVIVERIRKITFQETKNQDFGDMVSQGIDIAGALDVFVAQFNKAGLCDLTPGGNGCDIKDDCSQTYRINR